MKLPFEKIDREVLIKVEAETDNNYGKIPEQRDIKELLNCGVICLNKNSGPTSHQVADYLKRILEVNKTGHGGTLDPKVTGVLPVALNDATRVLITLLNAGKEYVALMYLHKDVDEKTIKDTFDSYLGKINQLPPKKSSVKRRMRQREIYYFEILEIEGRNVLFKLGCEAGFYVRKFIHDFGLKLKTGAHMAELVRTRAGPFNDKEMYSLLDLKDAYEEYKNGNEDYLKQIIKPIEFGVSHLPKIWIMDSTVDSLCHGANLNIPGISKLEKGVSKNKIVAVLTLKNELVGFGKSLMDSEEIMKNEKGTVLKEKTIFMKIGTYPKYEKNTN